MSGLYCRQVRTPRHKVPPDKSDHHLRRPIPARRFVRLRRYAGITNCPHFSARILNRAMSVDSRTLSVYGSSRFCGACLDTGAEKSVIGYAQAKAYCKTFGTPMHLQPSPFFYKFGDGIRSSLGTMEIRLPFAPGYFVPLSVDVVSADIPLLIALDTLDSHKLLADNVKNSLVCTTIGSSMPIRRDHGHLFVKWHTPEALFTTSELRRLHLHFFHPQAQRLYRMLRRARPEEVNGETMRVLEEIASACRGCKQHSSRPYRFRVSIPPNTIVFNEEVALDLFWIEGNPILHVVDTRTNFQNVALLKGQSACYVWYAFVKAWSSVYVGYPNRMGADQGSVFTSKLWEDVTLMHGIELQMSGVESHNSLGVGERYHGPIRRIFRVLRTQYPQLDSEVSLRLVVKGANDTLGPDGHVPSKLVFGVEPVFPVLNSSLPAQRERM
ncbi:unnamed protein product [Chondrus crispus]|uniref:Integrase catalytic domain-containing protein n=1 Tax=Chondrus crispus TaxID=2769 RepID=R7QHR7_CHOCR|nr:unnamed protein product [Chondrus crispus]CDF36991.1 unnamed protein product [Chondrus crispus]|eukprot:XP_005716810.1 unnamed protein product [Chondrus crispus]